ncbi:RNA-binding S4 domain-containing protein [Metallumcola ferriviriculae]|uniref:RNA-binding S4 domain-containing protein n=1 Tax=Metallumcola ferriviriculae TaxID=3039180 RepID=A0AAU0UJZ5_9FIRM|nr:RNA-binding S4 domain-containing protein [Desulfitibacteraceae bacterium MK1]
MREVYIKSELIRLDQLLKWADITSSGGEAKTIIQQGLVKVNGENSTQRTRKIFPGDVVTVENDSILICFHG